MVDMDQVEDGKVEVIGPGLFDEVPAGEGDRSWVSWSRSAGRKMQSDFEPVLERQIHYFCQRRQRHPAHRTA